MPFMACTHASRHAKQTCRSSHASSHASAALCGQASPLLACGPLPMAASTRPKNERCGVLPDASWTRDGQLAENPVQVRGAWQGCGGSSSSSDHRNMGQKQQRQRQTQRQQQQHAMLTWTSISCCIAAMLRFFCAIASRVCRSCDSIAAISALVERRECRQLRDGRHVQCGRQGSCALPRCGDLHPVVRPYSLSSLTSPQAG